MFGGGQNIPVLPGSGSVVVPPAGLSPAAIDPATLLPIDPFFSSDDFPLTEPQPPAHGDGDVIFLGPLGNGPITSAPAAPAQLAGVPEARQQVTLDPLPEPGLSFWQRLARSFLALFGQGWSPPLVPLSHDQAAAITQEGNPFGIHSNGKGHWVYPPGQKDAIIAHLHPWRVAPQDGGILRIALEGVSDKILLFPETPATPSPPPRISLDYAPLRPSAAQAKPIVFYHEDAIMGGAGGTKPGVTQWVQAMRGLGYNIIYVGSQPELHRVLQDVKPDIVLVSAIENLLPYVQGAYFEAKAANPAAITILGGFAAIPEFARFYDVVIRGESEVALPMVLSRLLAMLADGRIAHVEPAAWGTMVTGLDDFLAAAGRPGWVTEFVSGQPYYPPVLGADAAAELTALAGTRYIDAGSAQFAVGVPIGYDPRTQEPKVFVRSADGTVSATPSPLAPRWAGAQTRWLSLQPGLPFPLTSLQFAMAAEPIPVMFDEIDALYARYPSAGDGNQYVEYVGELIPGVPYSQAALYVQRGCRGDARCVFCSIPQKAEGRRASLDQVVRVMQQAVADGMSRFIFNDDTFVQNPRWMDEFLSRIEAEGLHRKIRIHVQTRIDTIAPDILVRMRGLRIEFSFGLETMDPARAERMRKVGPGQGARYVDKAHDTMRRLAAQKVPGDDYYMITVAHGDTLLDVARDTLSQLQVMDELWRDYGYAPHFRYSLLQAPYYGDQITAGLSGLANAQPRSIPVGASPWVTFGEIHGIFDPYGLTVEEGALHATGIFHPMSFVWPGPIRAFIRSFGGDTGSPSIGDIIEGLQYALAHSTTLSADDRRELQAILRQIVPLYRRILDEIGLPWLMSREERLRQKRAVDPFGRTSGPGIRF